MSKRPLVAICGRPNVGKSTLFNRITGKFRAIVHAEEGVTRDRHFGVVSWKNVEFDVVDTGGVVLDPVDKITRKIQEQVRKALLDADLILWVVDARKELTRIDLDLSDELRKLGKPVLLVANKLDNETQELLAAELYSVGYGDPIAVSATHGTNVALLLDTVVSRFSSPEQQYVSTAPAQQTDLKERQDSLSTRIAIVGRPNVGKSSLVNALLNEERMIVSDIPGTTRDSIDVQFTWKNKSYVLVDTAGLRRKSGIKKEVERFSVNRSLRSIREADVAVMLTDPCEGLTEQDKRIFEFIREQGTAVVWAWSKWDLIPNKKERLSSLLEEVAFKAPFCKFIPMLTVSSVTRLRLDRLLETVDLVAAEAMKRVTTGELNRLIQQIRTSGAGSFHKGRVARILYGTQASIKPTVFVLFVNQARIFHFSYVRHIENCLREAYGFQGVPIRIEIREGNDAEE